MDNPSFFSVAHSLGCILLSSFLMSIRSHHLEGKTSGGKPIHLSKVPIDRMIPPKKPPTYSIANLRECSYHLAQCTSLIPFIPYSETFSPSTEYEGHRVSTNGHNPLPLACMCMQCRSYLARGSAISSTPPIVVTPLSFLFIYSLH